VAHGADAARNLIGVGDAAQGRGHHVAVLQCGDELRPQFGIVAQPVQQLRPTPLGRVDAAAPGYSFKADAAAEGMCGASDLCRLAGRPMIAPEVVFAQRNEAFANRNDAGAGGIERDGLDLFTIDAADANGLMHGTDESGHLVVVALRLEMRVGGGAVQRIFRIGGAELAALLVEDGDAHAERAEVDPCHDAHGASPLFQP